MNLSETLEKPKEMVSPEHGFQISMNGSFVAKRTTVEKISEDKYEYRGFYYIDYPRPEYITSVQLLFIGCVLHERSFHKETGEPFNEHLGDPAEFNIEFAWTITWR